MDYQKINWKNKPSKDTPVNAENLNHMDNGIHEAHEEIKANTITAIATGETILLTDSANLAPTNLKLFGKTTQETTEGNQLLDIPDNTQSRNGITFDIKGGVCTIKGTATADTLHWFLEGYDSTEILFTLPAGEYYIKDCRIWSFDGTTRVNKTGAQTFTEDFNVTGVCTETYTSGTSVNATIYPMINKGLTALPFEPYTGRKPSPSIDYPQELSSCGDDGNIVGKLLNKNLLKNTGTTITKNGITFTVNEDKSVTCNGTATAECVFTVNPNLEIEVGKKHIVSGCPEGGSINTYFFAVSNFPNDFGSGSIGWLNSFKTLYTAIVIKEGVTVLDLTFKPMVRYADIEDDAYEPYTEQTLTSLTPNGLPGIPLGQTIPDGIKNSPIHMAGAYYDGEQYWIGDTIDYRNGKYVQRILEMVFDSSDDEDWLLESSTSIGNRYRIVIGADILVSDKTNGITSMNSSSQIGTSGSTYFAANLYTIVNNIINVSLNGYETLDEFKEIIAEKPMTVLCVLAEPIITDLTTEELIQYKSLHMNYPNTTITNDAGAYMEVEYVASPKEYIQNLEKKHDDDIKQLKTAIIALGGTI